MDGTEEMVRSYIDEMQLTVIKGNGNLWWAGCLQQGIDWLKKKAAKDGLVLFINDDVTFEKNFLEIGVGIIERNKDTLLLAKLIDTNTRKVKESGINADLSKLIFKVAERSNQINCLSTRGLFLRLDDIEKIGGFSPILLPHYWSDYEFTIRAYRKGVSLYTSNELYLYADETQTGFHYINEQNLLVFFKKLFSKKSVPNPVYKSVFILLSCPIKYIPRLIIKAWLQSFFLIAKQVRRSFLFNYKRIKLKIILMFDRNRLNIILGAGNTKSINWISTDYPIVDVTDSITLVQYFKPSSVDALLAEHVWEHLSEQDAYIGAVNCFNLLKSGGYLRIAVPDGFHPNMEYIDNVRPGGKGAGSDDHKILYNYKSLSELLLKAGFKVNLLEWFDKEGQFHFESWSESDGLITRSTRFDIRNKINPTEYTSLIIDAIKP
jgi:predicted SAM-dependent methyltransferase/GT2 family glycosyltransferase